MMNSTARLQDEKRKLDKEFTATLQKSLKNGGWTYVVMPDSVNSSEREAVSRSGEPSTAIPFKVHSWPWATAPTSCR